MSRTSPLPWLLLLAAGCVGLLAWRAWRLGGSASAGLKEFPSPEDSRGGAVLTRPPVAESEKRTPVRDDTAPLGSRPDLAESRLRPELAHTFQRTLGVTELEQASFAEDPSSPMGTVQIVVRNTHLKASDLRALFDTSEPESPVRCWAVLGAAYGSELGAADLAWLESLATAESGDPDPVQLAAIHAVRAASGLVGPELAGAMQRVTSTLLTRTGEGSNWWTNDGLCSAVGLALESLDHLPEGAMPAKLEELARAAEAPAKTSEVLYRTLARAGGADGARAVLDAALRGEPAAAPALRAVRDPSAVQDLLGLIESGEAGGDAALGASALSGLICTGDEAVFATLDSLLRPAAEPIDAAGAERRRLIALDGLMGVREPRARGLFLQIQHHLEALSGDPGFERSMLSAAAATSVKPWLMPLPGAREEVCIELRRALDALPRTSLTYSEGLYDLVRVGRPEDVTYVETNLVQDTDYTQAIEEVLSQIRSK